MAKHTMDELYQWQALPLNVKIRMTQQRIRDWVNYWGESGVYISFSGGKDSTVLLDICRKLYPNLKAVYVDTGLEYPEIKEFVKTFDNVDIVRPKMSFKQVVEEYGYPFFSKEVANNLDGARKYIKILTDRQTDRQTDKFHIPTTTEEYVELANTINNDIGKVKGSPIRLALFLKMLTKKNKVITPSKNKDRSNYSMTKYKFALESPFKISSTCCDVMKKKPVHDYEKRTGRKSITGQMASESRLRTQKWLEKGCNAFEGRKAKSNPMSFWTEQDVLLYIKLNNLPIASVYGEIVSDEGDNLKGQMSLTDLSDDFGIFDNERPLLKTTGLQRTGCMFCGFGCHLEKNPNRFEKMKETHPKIYDYVFKPESEGGLGYKEKIDWINENGNMNIKY